MTERVTVEHNGELLTLDVPDGTSDEEIHKFVTQQKTGIGLDLGKQANLNEHAMDQATMMTRPLAQAWYNGPAVGGTRDMFNIAKNVLNATPQGVSEMAFHPIKTAEAYISGHPWANTPIKNVVPAAGRMIGSTLTAPENAITLPYNMAAYEQEKIRQNPNAPGLEYNPYAQVQRGEFKNQGQAGEMNRKYSMIGQQYGGLTENQQNVLQEDRISKLMRLKAAQKVLAPAQPNQ